MENGPKTEESVRIIKDWLSQSPHLPAVEDADIRTFLRGRKYSLEKTKKVLELYYAVRRTIPEYFTGMDPTSSTIQALRSNVYLFCLPKLSPEGYRIVVSRWATQNPEIIVEDYIKYAMMLFKVILQEQEGTEIVFIYDMWNFSLTHMVKYFTIPTLKKYIPCLQDALPIRIKKIHVANAAPWVDTIVALVKPFLKDKLFRRIIPHNNNESLQKYLPKDILPIEYGGDLKGFKELSADWARKVEQNKDVLLREENIIQKLPPPPASLLNEHGLFGVDGSFRKLSID